MPLLHVTYLYIHIYIYIYIHIYIYIYTGVRNGIDAEQLRFIRVMKPLRWFKLVRVVKLNQSANVVSVVRYNII